MPIARGLGSALQDDGDAAAFMITLVALFPPAAVLSAVTPTVARVQLRDLETTGSVVGRLSAWATAGGLVGTFATGFVIVPLLPTDLAVVLLGGALLALGLVVALRRGGPVGTTAAAAAGALVIATATLAAGAPCDAETAYHCARVAEDPERPTGRLLMLERLRHSYVDLEDPAYLGFDYTNWIADAVGRDGACRRAARGGVHRRRRVHPAALRRRRRPGSRARVLEVDGDLVELARERARPAHRPGAACRASATRA